MSLFPLRFSLTFLALFLCYQAAEGIGIRVLGSPLWQGIFMVGTIPLALLLGWWFYRAPLGAYAMSFSRTAMRWLVLGFAAAFAVKLLALALGSTAGIYLISELPRPAFGDLSVSVALALFITFIPSLAEDILTRGLWFAKGPVRTGLSFVVLSTVVYVLNHIYRLANGPMEWLMLACFGIAYGIAVVRTGTLWAAVGLHWGWNATNAMVALMWNVDAVRQEHAVLMSSMAHLLLAAFVVLATRRRTSAASVNGASAGVSGT